jgi:hypothetical protein
LPQNSLVIEPGAILSSTNSALIQGSTNAALTVENDGTVRVDGGNLTVAEGVAFNDSGRIEVVRGTLAFQGGLEQTQGTTIIDSGATLSSSNFTVLGGTVSGSGRISANLVNVGGIISPGATFGILSTGPGQGYQQGASASLSVELGGASPGSGYDQFAVGGSASLDGQLVVSLVNGFVPQPGQTFQVLTCNSLVGKFASISTPPPGSAVWVPHYSASGVTLALANNMNLPRPFISGGAFNLSINTTPGVHYVVQATDDLNPPNWQTTTTITGDGTVKTASETLARTHRFYRVLLQ